MKKTIRRLGTAVIILGLVISASLFFHDHGKGNANTGYVSSFTYNTEDMLSEEEKAVVLDFLDATFGSLMKLEKTDIQSKFSNFEEGYLNQSVVDLMVEQRLSYPKDLRCENGSYSVTVTKLKRIKSTIKLEFLLDETMNTKLTDKTSYLYKVKCKMKLRKLKTGEIKVRSYFREQGAHGIFFNKYDFTEEHTQDETISLMNSIKDEQVSAYKKTVESLNRDVNLRRRKFKYPYNRDAALQYSYKYINDRNPAFYAFDDLGGNCQNFASQTVLAGGIPMSPGWTYVSISRRDPGWTGVVNFYNYVANSRKRMVAISRCNLKFAEPGDVVHVGYGGSYKHATVVSANEDGFILLNSNTTNHKDYPLFFYAYPNKRLIKILGYN